MELQYDLIPGRDDVAFDVDLLEQRAAAIPEVLSHMGAQREFLFCGTVHSREYMVRALQEGMPVSYDLIGVVVIHPRRIHVHQMATDQVLRKMESFLTPILTEYQCRVRSPNGEDLTSLYDGRWHQLFADGR